ncbi:MAG: CHAP domain-containing protein [Actinomycetota bacterium]|nr:CHAP domain-containing protein [Actinomycetota bacterium]
MALEVQSALLCRSLVMMARRELRRQRRRRRRVWTLSIVLVGIVVAAAIVETRGSSLPAIGVSNASAGVGVPTASAQTRARIVSLVQGQVGYSTDPASTYCNKFSAYWFAGSSDCGNANRDEQWCADFAAWAWRLAGVPIVYQFINGDLNSSSASFYEWGVRHHTWHPLASGYVPQAGDVAVYGLDAAALVAQHVAVVVSYTTGERGPNAVNGDGSHTGFSRVEYQANEYNADASGVGVATLAGYVSPNA